MDSSSFLGTACIKIKRKRHVKIVSKFVTIRHFETNP
jgi:hypothetical protein